MISGNCVELLRACHILPMFPEVTALQNAIRKKSLPLILKAEQAGYSSDNCAYVKADIGLFLDGGMGPGKPIPFPTITVCNYVGCNVYVKWFEHLRGRERKPALHAGRPVRPHRASRARATCAYVVSQLRELIALVRERLGQEVRHRRAARDPGPRGAGRGRLRAVPRTLCKHHPAPFDAYFDAINMMGPINVLRGTREAAEFFDAAVAEFEELVAAGRGAALRGALPHGGRGPAALSLLPELPEPLRQVGRGGGGRPPTRRSAASGSGASATTRAGRSSPSPSRCCART